MMDNGWLLEEDEASRKSESSICGGKYFTHPTYRGKQYKVYIHELSNGKLIMLPLVPQDEDPKDLVVLCMWKQMECLMRFAQIDGLAFMRIEKESVDLSIMVIFLDERKRKRNMKR